MTGDFAAAAAAAAASSSSAADATAMSEKNVIVNEGADRDAEAYAAGEQGGEGTSQLQQDRERATSGGGIATSNGNRNGNRNGNVHLQQQHQHLREEGRKRHFESDLTRDQVERYSRQMLVGVPEFGVSGQRKLLDAKVLVVGAGGIGSPLLLYLAGAGIGQIGVVDHDDVEMSNLHRQIIHAADRVGTNKAESARAALLRYNPTVRVDAVPVSLSHDNALELVSRYDVVVDASDNPMTRYLVNDACVLAKKPLVSASAVGTEGQLTVYNYPPSGEGATCYRCLYPTPPGGTGGSGASSCPSCADAGVLGPVPGLMGTLQAMEVIKIVTGAGTPMTDRLLMYDSLQCSFLSVKKPKRRQPNNSTCPVCGTDPTIRTMEDSRLNLIGTRGPSNTACSRPPPPGGSPSSEADSNNISCRDYKEMVRDAGLPHLLLDVRVPRQYEMCHLDGAVNVPLSAIIDDDKNNNNSSNGSDIPVLKQLRSSAVPRPVYCICRRGVASRTATSLLLKQQQPSAAEGIPTTETTKVYNIVGGLEAWHDQVDPNFPKY